MALREEHQLSLLEFELSTSAQRRVPKYPTPSSADGAFVKAIRTAAAWRSRFMALGDFVGNPEAANRVSAIVPALTAVLNCKPPSAEQALRRNVALHQIALGLHIAAATLRTLRKKPAGPYL